MTCTEQIRFNNYSFTYNTENEKALDGISLTVNKGEFVLVCGQSGSGKSTLLSVIKGCADAGTESGELSIFNKPRADGELFPKKIGFVGQYPDEQSVCDTVYAELAFGAESIGCDPDEIRLKIADLSAFFAIEPLLFSDIAALSGGQKQIINIAAAMVTRPDILLLDEPLAQLDAACAAKLAGLLSRINKELGITVVIAEHNLSPIMPLCTKTVVMDGGKTVTAAPARDAARILSKTRHPMLYSMPAGIRACAAAGEDDFPLTQGESHLWYQSYAEKHTLILPPPDSPPTAKETAIKLSDVCFSYGKDLPLIINNLSLEIYKGEIMCIAGGNAAGKSTLLKLIGGIQKVPHGKISLFGARPVYLPQDPTVLFSEATVIDDITMLGGGKDPGDIIKLCGLDMLLHRHPYDLSGGERQRAAIAKLLYTNADIFLLDEPCKGMDYENKSAFISIIKALKKMGKTVVAVSHDADFCAQAADRCVMLFGGRADTVKAPREFFAENMFFTTDAARIAKDVAEGIYTARQLAASCGEAAEPTADISIFPSGDNDGAPDNKNSTQKNGGRVKKRSPFKKICITAGIVTLIASMTLQSGLLPDILPKNIPFLPYLLPIPPMLLLLTGLAPKEKTGMTVPRKKPDKYDIAAAVITLTVIPITVFIAAFADGGRRFFIAALLIAAECMIPFFLVFERKRPSAGDIAVLALMCAAAAAGRGLFFMFPQFKPTAAVVIICGAAFGAQSAFMVGAVGMLVSDMMFAEGPWTIWQMLAMGLVGFFAGLIFRRRRPIIPLCLYALLSVVGIYGVIMNVSSALTAGGDNGVDTIFAYMLTGLPFDIMHGVATVIFLLLAYGLIEKCDRLRIKFGLFA